MPNVVRTSDAFLGMLLVAASTACYMAVLGIALGYNISLNVSDVTGAVMLTFMGTVLLAFIPLVLNESWVRWSDLD